MSAPLRRVVRWGPVEGWVGLRNPVREEILDCGHRGWLTAVSWHSRKPIFRPCVMCAARYPKRPKLTLVSP